MDCTSQDKERANKTFSKSCTDVRVGPQKRLSMEELMLSHYGAGENSWESLGQQEDQLVNPKGNQPWIFIGRTDAEAPIPWPPDTKSPLIGKDPDAGKDWKQEKKRVTEDEMVGWHHWRQWTWVWPNSRRQWRTGKPGVLQFIGSQTVGHNWATEQQDACKGMSESLHCSPESITILLIGYTSKEDVRWKWKWSCSVMSDSLRPHGL